MRSLRKENPFIMKFLDCTFLTIAIIGALNWGLIGVFRFDLVNFLFGNIHSKKSSPTYIDHIQSNSIRIWICTNISEI